MSTTEPNAAKIKVNENGPYVVSGSVPLVRKSPVMSEHGEPLTWKTSKVIDDGVAYALCRCGGSANKPYCDGTHGANGFDGTETASGTYDDRSSVLGGTRIVVRDDRSICVHAGFCGNQATNVWDMVANTDDSITRAQVMAMIERCPSGALTYSIEDEGGEIEPDLPVEVAITSDGPLWVSGGIQVEQGDGQTMETRNRVTLCRCGESKNKPLCDGAHADVGFSD